jgi:D-alanyl-D-alanine carboxypeptidase
MIARSYAAAAMKRLWLGVFGLLALAAFPAAAQMAPVSSPTGPVMAGPYIVIDAASGETLLQRDPGAPWFPASLTKLMTTYLVFEELKAGRLQLDTPVAMSKTAHDIEGINLGVPIGGSFPVELGLKALVVRSANDVAAAFGERIGGSGPGFAKHMTDTAHRLGMTSTEFRNANGLPDAGQVTTARDLAILTMALIKDFPQYYGYFHTDQLSYGKQHFNHGVKFVEMYSPYADGLKTGFICASGFNLIGSAVRDGRRLIAVALGFRRADLRDEFMVRLMDEAFALKTGGSRPKVWQLGNQSTPLPNVFPYGECGQIRYDMPGDAAWLGTFGDWRTARAAYDQGQAELAKQGLRMGKEWILPLSANKSVRQAAIIADLEPSAAEKLCSAYKARKMFCEVKKPSEVVQPFSGFLR